MKKFIVILLVAFFTLGITSCAVENLDTDPVLEEVQIDDQASEEDEEEEILPPTTPSN